MAEYYPLLERAVSGLTESTAEARRAIYERARGALIGQLRRMDPPVPEEDIARESTALDEAIARVEAGAVEAAAAKAVPPAAAIRVPPAAAQPAATQPIPPRRVPPAPSQAVRTPPRSAPPPTPVAPPPAAPPAAPPPLLPIGTAPPVVPPPSRERPVIGQRPAPSIDRPTMPGAAPSAGGASAPSPRLPPRPVPLATPRGTRPVMALRPVTAAAPDEAKPGAGLPAAGRLATDVAGAADASDAGAARDGSAFGAVMDAAAEAGDGREDPATAAPSQASPKLRDAPMRPQAPRPQEARRLSWPIVAAAVVALVLMIGIGVAAYHMRDKPEQVVATHSTTTAPDAAAPGKVAERAGGAADDVADAGTEPTSGAVVPVPVGQNADAPAPAPAPSIAVAQRAALLVDAPDDPQRVKTYVGTVVWHLDSVSPGQGQALATAIKADVDIPDAKLKITMLMQKNPEPQLPASHTIEFHFLPQPGNTLGPVKQVNVPEMRKDDDAATGDPLSGVPVAITDNYFLVGLSRGAAESQNMRLMTERNWVDMSILFTSGKLGKLTFEKGAAGQRSFEDALKAWK